MYIKNSATARESQFRRRNIIKHWVIDSASHFSFMSWPQVHKMFAEDTISSYCTYLTAQNGYTEEFRFRGKELRESCLWARPGARGRATQAILYPYALLSTWLFTVLCCLPPNAPLYWNEINISEIGKIWYGTCIAWWSVNNRNRQCSGTLSNHPRPRLLSTDL